MDAKVVGDDNPALQIEIKGMGKPKHRKRRKPALYHDLKSPASRYIMIQSLSFAFPQGVLPTEELSSSLLVSPSQRSEPAAPAASSVGPAEEHRIILGDAPGAVFLSRCMAHLFSECVVLLYGEVALRAIG